MLPLRWIRRLGATASCCALALLAMQASAQALPSGRPEPRLSKVEVYGGYSYFHPLQADINNYFSPPITLGAMGGASYFFGRHLGVQAEGTYSFPEAPGAHSTTDCAATAQAGPVARLPMRRVVPFLHILGGGARLGGPVFQPCAWGLGVTAGLGVDYILPGLGGRLAIRPIQADYEFNRVDYGPLVLPGGFVGGLMKMNAYRLAGGVVVRFGNMVAPVMVGMSCSAQPGDVFPGEPILVTAETMNLSPRRKTVYRWNTNGGRLSGGGETVHVDTAGLAPGNYVVSGRVSQGSMAEQQAECSAHFAIKAPIVMEPPTLTCSANPEKVHPNESSTITAIGISPQKRALTYSYTASAGTITGAGDTANLITAGVTVGSVTITCNVVDDLGKTATATTTVEMIPASLPPAPKTLDLCTIAFDRDKKRPARVDNEAKGCLDDIALTLQRQSDASLVMVGSHDPSETPEVAAQRTVNTKLYLTKEKGVDPSRIRLRSGGVTGRRVYHTLVPAGATFDAAESAAVDESTVKTTAQPYSTAKPNADGTYTRLRRKASSKRRAQVKASRARRRAASQAPLQ